MMSNPSLPFMHPNLKRINKFLLCKLNKFKHATLDYLLDLFYIIDMIIMNREFKCFK